MSEEIHTGGCLCGAVRYEIRARFLQSTLCHCEDCRKGSGAPFVAWSFFPAGSLAWTKGTPKVILHADRERSFCGDCGSPLTFFDPAIPHLFEANTNTLDDPARYPPADQCWVCDELPWTTACHGLPRPATACRVSSKPHRCQANHEHQVHPLPHGWHENHLATPALPRWRDPPLCLSGSSVRLDSCSWDSARLWLGREGRSGRAIIAIRSIDGERRHSAD